MSSEKVPIYDEPISPELAKEYVENYKNNKNYTTADFTGFYFHRDEIQIVLDQNKDKEYIKFTIGMKYLEHLGEKDKLYGCIMMTNAQLIIDGADITVEGGEDNIYDFSHPIPPYPPEE